MPNLPLRTAGYEVLDSDWNGIIADLNSLTSAITVSSGKVGVGTLLPSRQLHVYGLGQTTADLTDAGNKGGTLYLQDSGGLAGNGGALVVGSIQGHYAAMKGHLRSGDGNTVGDLAFSVRRADSDANLTEVLRLQYDGVIRLSGTIVHPFTSFAPTNSYASFIPNDPTGGGLYVLGLAGGLPTGIALHAFTGFVNTTKNATALGSVVINAGFDNLAGGVASVGTDGNLLVVQNNGVTQVIIDAEGDTFQNGTGWTTYDGEDDIAVLNLLTAHVTRADDPLKASFADLLTQSREPLERLGLARFDADGQPFVNMSKLPMLLAGAVRKLATVVCAVERRLQALEA